MPLIYFNISDQDNVLIERDMNYRRGLVYPIFQLFLQTKVLLKNSYTLN